MYALFRLALVAAVALAAATPAFADADVERISFNRSSDGHVLVARVHTTDRVNAYSVDQTGDAVEVVLYRTHLAPRVRREGAETPVLGYQIESGPDRVTIRFQVDPTATVRAYPDRDSNDLLLAFTPGVRPVAVRAPEPLAPSVPVARTAGPARGAPAGPRPAVTGAEHWRLDTIVLDAGHGAHDHGGVGNGTSDKEVALGVVSRLGPMLERELGVRVVYTRDDDTFVELRERGRIANREGGKLFISIHGNSAGSSSAYGTETFFLAPSKSSSALDVMERENSVIQLESAPELYESLDDEGDILQALAMSAYQEESQALATLIEREFVAAGRHSRGVKQGPFLVLWAASMPAVLVEVGFVSNPEEARYISSTRGLDETARALFNAIRSYKDQYERALRAAR